VIDVYAGTKSFDIQYSKYNQLAVTLTDAVGANTGLKW
jgi:hypothetical protein